MLGFRGHFSTKSRSYSITLGSLGADRAAHQREYAVAAGLQPDLDPGRTRVISIDDETVAILRQRKAEQATEQLKAGDFWRGTKDGYVFTTGWGEPIYPDTVTSLMTKLIRTSKQLPHARLHDLRHLHATTLLLSGVPVHVVAARLGHADPAITLRVYAHVIRSAEAAAADIFADAVKAAC